VGRWIFLFPLLFPLPAAAQGVRSLTDVPRAEVSLGDLDDASSAVWAVSADDPLGTNPGRVPQVFRWNPAVELGPAVQVTFFAEGVVVPDGPQVLGRSDQPTPAVSVSDNGQWLAFVSEGDLTGGNPDRNRELFLMNADGSVVRQLSSSVDPAGGVHAFALSGDGSRAVFLEGYPVLAYVVEADGSKRRRLTSSTPTYGAAGVSISDDGQRAVVCEEAPAGNTQLYAIDVTPGTVRALTTWSHYCREAKISGNGAIVVFETNATGLPVPPGGSTQCQGNIQIARIAWEGGTIRDVSNNCLCAGGLYPGTAVGPTITDDGATVVYAGDACGGRAFFRSDTINGASLTQLSYPTFEDPGGCRYAVVSGAGPWVAGLCDGAPFWAQTGNPDRGGELHGFPLSGADPPNGPLQITAVRSGRSRDADLTADGGLAVFASNAQPEGSAFSPGFQIYSQRTVQGAPVRITAFSSGDSGSPRVADDGGTVVFLSNADPLGQDPDVYTALYAIDTDGSDLRRLSPLNYPIAAAEFAGNGSVVVFRTAQSGTGEPDPGLYRVNIDGSGLVLLTEDVYPTGALRVDASGTWAVYVDDSWRLARMRTDASAPPEILFDGVSFPRLLDMSADGGTILLRTDEFSPQLAVWEEDTGTMRAFGPAWTYGLSIALSGDGAWVYATSEEPFFDPRPTAEIVRIAVATGAVERVDGLRPSRPGQLAVDHLGQVVVFEGEGRASGANPDRNQEIFVIDRRVSPSLNVSPGPGPTRVTWDVASGPATYDVIRGDVASLAIAGSIVDLGEVLCLDDDSPDATTAEGADPDTPLPGQAFFYVLRGSMGRLAGPGSYGRGAGDRERVAGPGGCS
jgi:Tol biopolymer transport system component